jgi:hypothetical protein
MTLDRHQDAVEKGVLSTESSEATEPPSPTSFWERLRILSQRRHRHTLLHLLTRDSPVSVDELIEHVASLEIDSSDLDSQRKTEAERQNGFA